MKTVRAISVGGTLILAMVPGQAETTVEISEPPITREDRSHWAWQPLLQPLVPRVEHNDQARNQVDLFVLARLEKQGLALAPQADRRTLIRRLYFDLLGLLPTASEVAAFVNDSAPNAYERLVEQLLAKPAHGERWAQHWLDLARFAETDGFEHDKVRPNAWRYRDWVIGALNDDLAYDQFMKHQLAGDEISPEAAIGTGFLIAGQDMPDINLLAERRHMVLNEMTATVGAVFLGMSLECAQCHDHKSDPISQGDFYRLRAFFENGLQFKEQKVRLVSGEITGRVMRETGAELVRTHLSVRGDFRRPGREVSPNVPRIASESAHPFSALKVAKTAHGRRTALAKWMTSGRNPLILRSVVNRLWQHHFNRPLAGTPNDLGRMGDRPTHPLLLDWLAAELPRRGWSLKSIHRLLVTSATYRQVSSRLPGQSRGWQHRLQADPANRLWSRMDRRRLDGESVRDTLLAVSGRLSRHVGGPGTRPPLPKEITSTLLNKQWQPSPSREDHFRRSVYLFARRNLRYPLFDLFDRPAGTSSCARRKTSITAPQSLMVLNSGFSLDTSRALARRAMQNPENPGNTVRELYAILFQRNPSQDEAALAERFLERGTEESVDVLVQLCLALINLNEFFYID